MSDRVEHLAEGWQLFFENPPDIGRKFIALYNDGSGAVMFFRTDGGFIDSDGDELTEIGERFDLWIYLPHDKEFWCELRSENHVRFPPTMRFEFVGGTK